MNRRDLLKSTAAIALVPCFVSVSEQDPDDDFRLELPNMPASPKQDDFKQYIIKNIGADRVVVDGKHVIAPGQCMTFAYDLKEWHFVPNA